jgi:hypothetical protein
LIRLNAIALLSLGLWSTLCLADGYIETQPGPLDDDSFYNVIVCGELPGNECKDYPPKWSSVFAQRLTVRLHSLKAGRDRYELTSRALDAAIADINSVTPALQLRRQPDRKKKRVNIDIFVSSLKTGQAIKGTGTSTDGKTIEGAMVNVTWNNAKELQNTTIVFAGDLLDSEVSSIVLEELAQALGPINDIRNPHYEGVSIFSEDSNAQTVLGSQDRMVLKRLYAQ